MSLMQERLAEVQRQIQECPQAVRLVAVTKYASLAQMQQLYELGVRDFGENKAQDALQKIAQLPRQMQETLTWHFIGHLQSNKVNKVVGRFAWIHSVDSVALAEKISAQAGHLGITQTVLLQVNLSGEASKTGFSKAEIEADFVRIATLPNLDIKGLMTIAPVGATEARLVGLFRDLRNLKDSLSQRHAHGLSELSMGMSHDYGHALKSGATIIRIGQYLLGS